MNKEKGYKYLIDDKPVEWFEIIKMAKELYGYDADIKLTSVASRLLRDHGHTVEENPKYKNTK